MQPMASPAAFSEQEALRKQSKLALLSLSCTNDFNALQTLLETESFQDYANVDEADEDGINALIFACALGNVEAVRALLRRSANVNHTDKNGWTPLVWSLVQGNYLVASELVKHGALTSDTQKTKRGHSFSKLCVSGRPNAIKLNELSELVGLFEQRQIETSAFGLRELLNRNSGSKSLSTVCAKPAASGSWKFILETLQASKQGLVSSCSPSTYDPKDKTYERILVYKPKDLEQILEVLVQHFLCPLPSNSGEGRSSPVPLPLYWTAALFCGNSSAVGAVHSRRQSVVFSTWSPLTTPTILYYITRYATLFLSEKDFQSHVDQVQFVFLRLSATETASPTYLLHAYHCLLVLSHFLSKDPQVCEKTDALIKAILEIGANILQVQLFKAHILSLRQLVEQGVLLPSCREVSKSDECSSVATVAQVPPKQASLADSFKAKVVEFFSASSVLSAQMDSSAKNANLTLMKQEKSRLTGQTTEASGGKGSLGAQQTLTGVKAPVTVNGSSDSLALYFEQNKGAICLVQYFNEWILSTEFLGLSSKARWSFWTTVFKWLGKHLCSRILFSGLSKVQLSAPKTKDCAPLSAENAERGLLLSDKVAVHVKLSITSLENWVRKNEQFLVDNNDVISKGQGVDELLESLALPGLLCSFLQMVPQCQSLEALLEILPRVNSSGRCSLPPKLVLHMLFHYQWPKNVEKTVLNELITYLQMVVDSQKHDNECSTLDDSYESCWDKNLLPKLSLDEYMMECLTSAKKWATFWNYSKPIFPKLLELSHQLDSVEPLSALFLSDYLKLRFS